MDFDSFFKIMSSNLRWPTYFSGRNGVGIKKGNLFPTAIFLWLSKGGFEAKNHIKGLHIDPIVNTKKL